MHRETTRAMMEWEKKSEERDMRGALLERKAGYVIESSDEEGMGRGKKRKREEIESDDDESKEEDERVGITGKSKPEEDFGKGEKLGSGEKRSSTRETQLHDVLQFHNAMLKGSFSAAIGPAPSSPCITELMRDASAIDQIIQSNINAVVL